MDGEKCPLNLLIQKIKNLFGEPNQGIHSHRLCGIAYIDVLLTILGAYLIHKAFYPETEYYKVLLFLFILGIILHRIFDVKTTVDRFIFN